MHAQREGQREVTDYGISENGKLSGGGGVRSKACRV